MKNYLVEKISDLLKLSEIRKDWEKIYHDDSHSQVYISWLWFWAWANKAKSSWVVIGVKCKTKNSYVAFLPLSYHTHKIGGIGLLREIKFGGKPYSVYSSFLCLSNHESGVFEAIANFIQNELKWEILRLQWVRDSRLKLFIKNFSVSDYSLNYSKGQVSLIATLPDNFELLFNQSMTKKTRKNIRKCEKQIESNDNYRITVTDDKTVDRDIEIMCKLWNNHWSRENELEWYSHFMHHYFKNKLLRLTILWDRRHPVSALSCLLDPVKQTYNPYITSFDPAYFKISPGIYLITESIKHAIEEKYRYYDFTVGLDSYKLSYGPTQYETKNISIKRKSLKIKVATSIFKKVNLFLRK